MAEAKTDPNSIYYDPNDLLQTITSSGGAGTTVENKTSVQSTNQVSSQASYQQNIPQQALESLLGLIDQLSGKEVIDPLVDKTYPLLIKKETWDPRTGRNYYYLDPASGQSYTEAEALRINSQRQAIRQQYTTYEEGGTPETKFFLQERKNEIGRDRAQQEQYSKDAAFNDAKKLTEYFQRQMLEELMPSINAAAEGAGTSKGSMRALQAQRAGEVTGEKAAALGAQLSTNYGQIWNQLAGTLEELTRIDPNSSATHLLLQALNQAKGTIQSGATVGSTRGTAVTNQSGVSQTAENKNVVQDYYRDSQISNPSLIYNAPQAQTPQSGSGSGWYSVAYADPEPQPSAYSSWDPTNRSEIFEQEVTF